VENLELIRRFLRREPDELAIYSRDWPATLSLLAFRLFAAAVADPEVHATEPTGHEDSKLHFMSDPPVVWRTVKTGYDTSERMVVEGLSLIEHRGFDGLRMALNLAKVAYGGIRLQVIVRREDSPRLAEIEAWLERLLDGNHPLKGHLLQLHGKKLSFLPPQDIDREAIVMPPEIPEELERSFGFLAGFPMPPMFRHRSVLLAGVPGVGKTLLCRWLAGVVNSTVLWVTPGTVWEFGPENVFAMARMLRPTLLILEDMDVASGKRRGGNPLGELLTEMDGFSTLENVGIVATTNHPEVLDEALDPRKRPGRFHRMITIEPPDRSGRELLLRRLVARSGILPEEAGAAVPRIAQAMSGATGARLAELVRTMEHRWTWETRHGRRADMDALVDAVLANDTPRRTGVGFEAGAA